MAMGLASYEPLQISRKCTDTRNGSVQTGILATARFGCGSSRSREEVAAIQFSSVRRWPSGAALPLMKAPIQRRTPSNLVVCSIPPVPPSGSSVQIASTLFTLGTAFVVPFYTAMIVAPKSKWTKKLVESDLPFVILGAAYIFLLYLSWTPETLGLMFASKYLLPELPGITRMFSSTITVASAWLHLLVADLFCGRYVYLDGLQHKVETRHSLVLCLMMCPIGIVSHVLTKVIASFVRRIDGESTPEIRAVLA